MKSILLAVDFATRTGKRFSTVGMKYPGVIPDFPFSSVTQTFLSRHKLYPREASYSCKLAAQRDPGAKNFDRVLIRAFSLVGGV